MRLDRQLEVHMWISQAQGALMQSGEFSAGQALVILQSRADRAGVPLPDAARWLLSTGTLP